MSGRGGGRGGRFESNPNKNKNPTPHTNNNNNNNKNHSRSHGNNRGEMSQQGCFKCGEIGHLSRECTKAAKNNNPANNYRRNLNLNIDGTLKNDVGKILKEFQDNPTLTEYAFPPDLTNTERRFIHTFCKNFGLTSKSTGGPKGSPNRYVVIYKGKEKKEEKAARKHPLPKLAFNRMESTSLIDGFLQYYQTPPNVAASSSSSSASSSSHSPQETVDLQKLASDYARELAAAPSNPARQQLSSTLQHLHDDRTKQRASATSVSSLQQFRRNLPIAAQREDILRMIDANQVIVLSSSTGSGKSTQVPQYILEHLDGLGRGGETDIIVTQPRRISAMSLAQRVAQEREVEDDGLGGTVGYQIRLEACRSNKTRLLYCTIGVLLRRLSSDRLLRGISHIIVDEVHERDRLADFLLIILKDILPIRPDLKLILMSATLNADMFSTYFNNCPHIHIEGFTYPVHTFYLEDVIELTGYQPPALNSRSMDASQRRQVEAAKEKKLRDLLNLSLNQVLTIESKVPTKHGGMVVNPSKASLDDDDDAGKDDEAALAALANIASMGASESFNGAASASSSSSSTVALSSIDSLLEPTNLVTGWTDTFVYKPEVDNPFDNSTTASTISLDSIIAGVDAEFASKSNTTTTAAAATTTSVTVAAPEAVSALPPSNKKLHPSQISSAALTSSLTMLSKSSSPPASSSGGSLQNPLSGLNYSRATLDVIQRIEDEGMDYIDYDLILNVILFICQKFDDSLLGGGAKSSSSSDDDDPINIYNGSILVFLPGWEDICKLLDMVAAHPVLRVAHKYLCLPLHGSISSQQQRQIFVRPEKGQRKIIFSTNIAETSITIDDVVFVLDSGKMKEKTYDAMTKMCALSSTWISQANAKQRSGRAGRCRRGVCFRLYTQKKYDTMEVFQTPELLRTPLEELCLQVKLLRLGKVDTFLSKALQPPTRPSILDALDLLTRLGALTSNEDLTLLGEYLAAMPLDPRLAKMILYGAIFKCLDPILTIAASLSYRDPFILPVQWEREKAQLARQKLANGSQSDMLCLLHAYHGYIDQQRTNGIRGASAFCREYFLSLTTMQMIEKLKVQYMDTLKETGWLDHLVPSGANSVASVKSSRSHDHSSHSRGALRQLTGSSLELNVHQHNLSVLTAIICLGMYPMCAKVQPQNPHKKRRAILCTRNNLQNICLHPASVSSKDFRRAATHADAWTIDARLNINPPSDVPSYVQYCVFFESMRSSEVFLRNVHWVQPLCLALFGTGDRTLMVRGSPPPLAKKEKKMKSEKQARREREYEDDEDEDDENVDELIENIFAENDDDDDDDYDDDDESDLDDDSGNIFHVDEWIRFGVHPSDGQRILQLRSFLSFIVDSFMRRSGVHSTSSSTPSLTPAMVQVADQAVEFFVKLLTYELAPPNAQIKAHANVQMQPPVAAHQHQPQHGHPLRSHQQTQPQTHRNGPQPTPQHHQQQRPASAQVRHQSKQPQSHLPHQSHPSVHHSGPLTVAELEAKLARLQVEAVQESVQSSTSQQARTLYQPPSLDSSRHPSHHRRNNHADENDSHPRGDSRRGGGGARGRGNGRGGRGRGGRGGGQGGNQQRHA